MIRKVQQISKDMPYRLVDSLMSYVVAAGIAKLLIMG